MRTPTDNTRSRITTSAVRYAGLLANQLFDEAKLTDPRDLVEFGYPVVEDDAEPVRVFRGYLQSAGAAVGLSQHNTGVASRVLHAMRAITTLKPASPKLHSVVMVSYVPTEQQYADFLERSAGLSRNIVPSRMEKVESQIKDLTKRIEELESRISKGVRHDI